MFSSLWTLPILNGMSLSLPLKSFPFLSLNNDGAKLYPKLTLYFLNTLQKDIKQKIGKGVCQGCILSPCLFNFYAEYIMRNAGLEETQAGIKIAGRNINNLRYADDTTLMAETEEELKSLLMKVKEESEKLA